MKSDQRYIITINGGSSSIKFALYDIAHDPVKVFSGGIEGLGSKNIRLHTTLKKDTIPVPVTDHEQVISFLMDWLEKQDGFDRIAAIGHRVVHGMEHTQPEKITPALLDELHRINAYDPDHLPEEIKLIELFSKKYPDWVTVACFDTAFHTAMPAIAKLLPIPARFREKGIQRYGFHGLSYAYLLEKIRHIAGIKIANGRIIMAHLGSGASLTAVKGGKSMDTSMGFTPAAGLPMGTRTGDMDPGVAWYLMQAEKLSPKQFNRMVNHECGLLGVSGTSSDMQELLKIRKSDTRAAEAIALFCYQAKKTIGAYTAVLGGLDTLVFSGGIGEHAPEVRKLICSDLDFLGIDLDQAKNKKNELIISKDSSRVTVYVIPTNEELMMARQVHKIMTGS